MGRNLPGDTEVLPNGATISLSVHQLFAQFKEAMAVGSQHATDTIATQHRALNDAYNCIGVLVEKVVVLGNHCATISAKAVALAEVEAGRDVRLAQLDARQNLERQLFALAESPFGKQFLATLQGIFQNRNESEEQQIRRTAAKRVFRRLITSPALVDLMAETAGDEWNVFLDYMKESLS